MSVKYDIAFINSYFTHTKKELSICIIRSLNPYSAVTPLTSSSAWDTLMAAVKARLLHTKSKFSLPLSLSHFNSWVQSPAAASSDCLVWRNPRIVCVCVGVGVPPPPSIFFSPQEFTCQSLLKKSAVTQRALWVALPQNHWIRKSSSTLCGPFEGKCYLFILSFSSSPSPKSWGKTPGV